MTTAQLLFLLIVFAIVGGLVWLAMLLFALWPLAALDGVTVTWLEPVAD